MNTRTHRFYAIGIVAVFAWAVAGCSTPGRNSATKAADAVTALQQRMTTGEQQMDSTVTTLVDLVNQRQGDLRPQYQKFRDSVDKLEAQVKKGRSERAAVTTQADAYFAKWEQDTKTLQNEDIRQVAASRRETVKASFDKINGEFNAAKPVFESLMRDLGEIKQALDFDLTPGGTTAMKPVVAKVQGKAATVKTHIATIRAELGHVSAELAATASTSQ
ncbi:MAG TPA: DUF2959 family protein [Steroidobacteraceae bacterium]|nr:DUF2959 family protein [Steroidobacteraceae bacterium]